MKKSLFANEEIIKTWKDCTLTNKRVWQYTELGGQAEYRGFPLSQYQGAIVGKKSYQWLLYIGGIICLLSLFTLFGNSENKAGAFAATFVFGCGFIVAWHFTKRARVYFSSVEVGITVNLHANDQYYAEAVEFISDLERVAGEI